MRAHSWRRTWPPSPTVKGLALDNGFIWEGNPPSRGLVGQQPLLIQVDLPQQSGQSSTTRLPSNNRRSRGQSFSSYNGETTKNVNNERLSRCTKNHLRNVTQDESRSRSQAPAYRQDLYTSVFDPLDSPQKPELKLRTQSRSARQSFSSGLRPKRPTLHRSPTSRGDVEKYMNDQILEARRDEVIQDIQQRLEEVSERREACDTRSLGIQESAKPHLSRSNSRIVERPEIPVSSSKRFSDSSNSEGEICLQSSSAKPGRHDSSVEGELSSRIKSPVHGYRDSGYPSPPGTPPIEQNSHPWYTYLSTDDNQSTHRSRTPSPLGPNRANTFPRHARTASSSQPSKPIFRSAEEDTNVVVPKPVKANATAAPRLSVFSPGNTRRTPAIDNQHAPARRPPSARPMTPETKRPTSRASSPSAVSSSSEKSSRTAGEKIASLPACPRSAYNTGFEDWYSLEKSPYSSICPACYDQVIEPTRFRNDFTQEIQPYGDEKVRCDFSLPWVRMSWLLIRKQGRNELSILQAMLDNEIHTKACPGARLALRPWKTIIDPASGDKMETLNACPSCVKSIEIALPPLKGIFVDTASSQPKQCSLRTDRSEFIEYLDLLDRIARKSAEKDATTEIRNFIGKFNDSKEKHETISRPDIKRTVSFNKPKVFKPPEGCPRATAVTQAWYFVEKNPRLHICEPCYNAFVLPHLCKGSKVAGQFNHAMKLVLPIRPLQCRMNEENVRNGVLTALEREDLTKLGTL